MDQNPIKPLSLGTASFERLRKTNQIYVDKTFLIYELASKAGKFFLTRPRRFGKSLLISTFESLFEYGLRDFEGLQIEKLWKEKTGYQVVRLDFSEIKQFANADEFNLRLSSLLARRFNDIGFEFKENKLFPISDQLSDWLKTQKVNSLVLLIDEYDAPLTACLEDNDLFEEVRGALANFYAVLKSNDAQLRFLFITGITRFNKTSIFSELNNLSDISFSPNYATLLGYTKEEVQIYFSQYLDSAAEQLDISRDKLFEALLSHYDGFCFDETAKQRVFVPWSLLKFFAEPIRGFKNYWFESGGRPEALVRYMRSHTLRRPEEYVNEKTIPLSVLESSSDAEHLSDTALLTQTGYLTIKAVKYEDIVFLDYPNREVKRSMAQLYVEQLLKGKLAGQVGAGPIVEVLRMGTAESLFHILNRLFVAIDYQNYPVRDEASVRAFTQIYMSGAGLDPKIETHNAHGRSDLSVKVGHRKWILEFKVLRAGDSAEKLLNADVEQIIQKKYGEESEFDIELIRVALVFSIEKREFVKWMRC